LLNDGEFSCQAASFVTLYGSKRTHLQVCSVAYPILEAVDELPAREPYGGGYFGMIVQAKHSSAKGHLRRADVNGMSVIAPIATGTT
jgi:hypothetical protein